MRIEAVEAFYLSMPKVKDIGDGSQDMLLYRVSAGDYRGWGESEAAPLVSIAALVCPMSHSACRPVLDSVLGETIESPDDIARIVRQVRAKSLDVLQAPHALSGIEIALWDLVGKARQQPVYELLGFKTAEPRVAYVSALFGDEPQATLQKAKKLRSEGFRAAKFGWGPYGHTTAEADAQQVHAAREGLGEEADLLVDAGTVWVNDVDAAALRLPALEEVRSLAGGAVRLGGSRLVPGVVQALPRRASSGGRRGRPQPPHGLPLDPAGWDRLRPDRRRPHWRDFRSQPGGRVCPRQRSAVRQSHLHLPARTQHVPSSPLREQRRIGCASTRSRPRRWLAT